jgi:protein transport protein SEC23
VLQVGLAEAKVAVDSTGGMIVMAETFDSDQFKKSLQRLFSRDEEGLLKMVFNASIEVMTTREVKVCGTIGPCSSLQKKGASFLILNHDFFERCAQRMGMMSFFGLG